MCGKKILKFSLYAICAYKFLIFNWYPPNTESASAPGSGMHCRWCPVSWEKGRHAGPWRTSRSISFSLSQALSLSSLSLSFSLSCTTYWSSLVSLRCGLLSRHSLQSCWYKNDSLNIYNKKLANMFYYQNSVKCVYIATMKLRLTINFALFLKGL